MNDSQCVAFLQWALPQLGMRWAGYRKVRRQVCNRARRRANELWLSDLDGYRMYLEAHPEEWALLDSLTSITISRFYRDNGTFDFLTREVLPALAIQAREGGRDTLEVWSAGCASGEEPYTLAIIWELELAARFPALAIRILATDVHPAMLDRAPPACFSPGSLRELPEPWRTEAFEVQGQLYCVRAPYKQGVTVAHVRTDPPDGFFDLIMCRNLVFTYFEPALQRTIGTQLASSLRPAGTLVLGAHERLPVGLRGFELSDGGRKVYRPSAHTPRDLIGVSLRDSPRLCSRDRLDGLRHPGAVRERAQQSQSLVHWHAELTAVIRKAQAGGAARPVDVQADFARLDSQQLAPQSLSPLRRVVGWSARYRIRRHVSMIVPHTRARIGRRCGHPPGLTT
jgi:chemotaxis protein methyltransferase CheR